MRREVFLTFKKHSYKNIKYPCPILLEFSHSSPPLCKNYTKPDVDTYFDQGLCIFFIQMLKTVSILFINWSKHFIILRGSFQIYSGNNTFLLLYAFFVVINLISKGVIEQYVHGWVKCF